jgi:hypothetical protein
MRSLHRDMTTAYSELQAKASGVFHGYDFGYGFGMAYPGYVPPSYSEYPNGYMPGASCYWPYTG